MCLMEFDKSKRLFCFLQEIELSSVPTKNDKIVINEKDCGYIFLVYDVHYAEYDRIDINIIRLSSITDYNSSKFLDIPV